ncbi:Domain of uncharacterised function (DUF2825) [Klebsiella quasivariicola]|nr:Domain of uncharacterised function (DUF2825) [Klebsiella quasivariicola]
MLRFIPAGAGNTFCLPRCTAIFAVYPRWRGEHISKDYWREVDNGLSPLARGTLTVTRFFIFSVRFIPAGAGNTKINAATISAETVYPRWRGEHTSAKSKPGKPGGLSPLARGTPRQADPVSGRVRFIPAGAGNTPVSAFSPESSPVYPRWRGEHKFRVWQFLQVPGLSPLARGTRMKKSGISKPERFIPAGAGNTGVSLSVEITNAVYPRWRGEHTKHILLFFNAFLRRQQSTNFIPTISHY